MKLCLKCGHPFVSDGWLCPECEYSPSERDGFIAHSSEFADSGGGFKPEYFSRLSKIEPGNFWFRARNTLILWSLRAFKPNLRSFLEIGCGTGYVLSGVRQAFPQATVNGSEIFVEGLHFASARVPDAVLMQMDARHIPFVDEFDAIGAFDVLEHISEDSDVLGQLYRAVRPGGVILLTVPQHPWLWSASDDFACHVRRYRLKELVSKVERVGFYVERSTSFVSLLLPIMMVSRFRRRKIDPSQDLFAEFNISAPLNNSFRWVMNFERWLIRLGINFPVGGSRLVVARKPLQG